MKDSKEQLTKRIDEMMKLIVSSKNAAVSYIDEDGYPTTRMMFARMNEGFGTHYFSTNVSSHHTSLAKANPKACVYYFNNRHYKGLTLIGKMEVCTDHETRDKLWTPGDEIYYPKGVDDEDYCVLKFTVEHGSYYYGMGKFNFTLEELQTAANK